MKRGMGICLGLGAAAVLGCLTGLRAQQPATVDVSGYPAEVQKQYKLFAEKCSRCHDLSRPLSARYSTEAQWRDLVSRMARLPGAGISPRDQASITAFLVFHQQAKATASAGRTAARPAARTVGVGDVSGYPPEIQRHYKVFADKCSRCHDLTRPLAARYSGEAQWRDLVLRMARRPGAGINRRDVSQITTFLVYHEKARSGAALPAEGAAPSAEGVPDSTRELVSATVDGLRAEAELLPPQTVGRSTNGQWVTSAPAAGENAFLMVRLYDEATGEKVPFAAVQVRLGAADEAPSKALAPLFGSRGLYYGSNITVPSGELPILLDVEPPALGGVNDEGRRWSSPVQFKLTLRGR